MYGWSLGRSVFGNLLVLLMIRVGAMLLLVDTGLGDITVVTAPLAVGLHN